MSTPSDVYLLDTNILVHLIRERRQGRRLHATFGLDRGSRGLVSVVTVGETLSLARQWGWGADALRRMHEAFARTYVVDIGLPDILDLYAEIDSECIANGRKMGKNDLWLAATADYLNIPLLTTDTDFDHLGGRLQVVRVDPTSPK